MTTFIIVSLMILVLVITILYVHKVITSSHLEEELITVFKNLSNINAYINNISETQRQSPNTEIKETDIINTEIKDIENKVVIDLDDLREDVKSDNIDYMRNGALKCDTCSTEDKDDIIEPCKTCISSGTKCNFIQDKEYKSCFNCVNFQNDCITCKDMNEFVLHVE